ncbi:transposase [Streptomyces sp. F001]|nr:transposase [Streptomyces sp. F001]
MRVQLTDPEWEFIGLYLPIGEYGPYPERLRQQFDGVIWRFKTGSQWREMPQEFGAWSTVHNRFRQWRDAGVFEALLEGVIAEAAKRSEVDLSLVSIDSTTARAHHDAAGMHLREDVLTALEKGAAEEEKARSRGAALRGKSGRTPKQIPYRPQPGEHLRPGRWAVVWAPHRWAAVRKRKWPQALGETAQRPRRPLRDAVINWLLLGGPLVRLRLAQLPQLALASTALAAGCGRRAGRLRRRLPGGGLLRRLHGGLACRLAGRGRLLLPRPGSRHGHRGPGRCCPAERSSDR